jgi:hypothetical protein
MGIVLTRIEIGGNDVRSSWGPWLGLILVAVVLPTLVLPLLLVAVLLEMSAPVAAVPVRATGRFVRGGRSPLSPRSPPLA